MRRPPPDTGFTVMEVMVAILILAVAVVSIFGQQFTQVFYTWFLAFNRLCLGSRRVL